MERKTEQMITDLKNKQIEIITLTNIWAFSRLIAENERAGETLARELDTAAEALPSYAFCLGVPGSRAPLSESHTLYFSPSFALTYPWFSALVLGVRTDNLFSFTGMVE